MCVLHGGDQTGLSDTGRAWARVRANLRLSAGARLFDQWLAPMSLVEPCDGEDVRLALPSAFMADWVRNHYAERLVHEFRALLPRVRSVAIETRRATTTPEVMTIAVPAPAQRPAAAAAPLLDFATAPVTPAPRTVSEPVLHIELPQLDPRYTFERFVADPSNRVALNAARALAEPGPVRFSPLFIHGGTGQGKSHLMHAIGHAFLEARPDARVLCMSAERFMFDFVAAMRARDTHAFKSRLRGCDLLLIDDLQFIAGKDATQEEFFHTINEIMAAGKRLVISADRAPQALDGVESRILGRMSAGLVADVKGSTLELRRAVLAQRLAELPDAIVPEEVVDMIACRIASSIREVEGALNRVVAYASLTGEVIDLGFAQSVLGDTLRGVQRRVTIDEIQKLVSEHFEIKQIDLLSARRARAVARPRQIAMYLAKRMTTRSLPEIGRKFGGRDHSTVIHAVRRIEELRDTDRDVDGAVRSLIHQLEA
ncbi:chromosomal replication initiator protein DnaA [uncultured Sphingomonas sp.]|uniref:chromosomal replication initiator protein DnaA n=1 Tax=uncultured Sphingomonas sp. TaxID=158754 RepID=UPI0025E69F96|nr:chromosomal replication initiator protein DnaA [uncultured Sphingomonas sp.]